MMHLKISHTVPLWNAHKDWLQDYLMACKRIPLRCAFRTGIPSQEHASVTPSDCPSPRHPVTIAPSPRHPVTFPPSPRHPVRSRQISPITPSPRHGLSCTAFAPSLQSSSLAFPTLQFPIVDAAFWVAILASACLQPITPAMPYSPVKPRQPRHAPSGPVSLRHTPSRPVRPRHIPSDPVTSRQPRQATSGPVTPRHVPSAPSGPSAPVRPRHAPSS